MATKPNSVYMYMFCYMHCLFPGIQPDIRPTGDNKYEPNIQRRNRLDRGLIERLLNGQTTLIQLYISVWTTTLSYINIEKIIFATVGIR